MAIVQNFWLDGASKRLAGAVIYNAMGQTRARRLAASVTNPRTEAQMNQRVKWANLVNLYRVNSDWMKYAYETKKITQSEYNKWMSLNVTNSRIYLTKQLAAAGACVVDAYTITQGSLPSIENTQVSAGQWASNIYITGSSDLDESTVATFTGRVLANNPGIREGDQISLIRLSQQTNADNGVPYVIQRKYELVLSRTNDRLVTEYLPDDIVTPIPMGSSLALGLNVNSRVGGFAWILSRTIAGKTYVSTQKIVPVNNGALISLYSSDEAYRAAIESYGTSEEAFLSSATVNASSAAAIPAAIVRMEINGVPYTVGTRVEIEEIATDDTIDVFFNEPIPQAQGNITLNTNKGTILASISEATGSKVSGSINQLTAALENVVVYDITVDTSFGGVRAQFAIYNSDSQEGLE
ncbi:MAG: hypothetical protein IKL03_04435 [Bacteroidaceae bacterium]|nr:hypothetical protein [Bacteroidaceae bacterium]